MKCESNHFTQCCTSLLGDVAWFHFLRWQRKITTFFNTRGRIRTPPQLRMLISLRMCPINFAYNVFSGPEVSDKEFVIWVGCAGVGWAARSTSLWPEERSTRNSIAIQHDRTRRTLRCSTIIRDINLPDGGQQHQSTAVHIACFCLFFESRVDLNNARKVPQIELFIFENWHIFKMALLSLATVSVHFFCSFPQWQIMWHS